MEKSLINENLTQSLWDNLEIGKIEPRQLSPLVLAYIGDSIYDLVVKTYIVGLGNTQVNKMNKKASGIVKAQTQSEIIGYLEEYLTEEEDMIYKRGRNAKSYTSAKNATIGDYRRATGFEALMGYLYLTGQYDRMTVLIRKGLDFLNNK